MATTFTPPAQRGIGSGWTAASLSHNQDLHAATIALLDSSEMAKSAANRSVSVDSTGKVLGYTSVPSGVTTGTATVAGNASIPATIQAATQNLQTNTQNNNWMSLLNKILNAQKPSAPAMPVVINQTSPAMEQYYQNKNTIMQQPAEYQKQIDAQTAAAQQASQNVFDSSSNTGFGGIGIMGGGYEGSAQQKANQARMDAVLQQNQAKQAAQTTGWLPYVPQY